MKAIYLEEAGGIENLRMKDAEKPSIGSGKVLVEVRAISINPADVKAKYTDEMLNMMYGPERPILLGWDIAGKVSAVGDQVIKFKKGDKVFGMVNFPGVGNAYAEYVAAPEDHLSLMPENVSYEEAAAATLAALTALQVMKDKVGKGDSILIHAGSGGVGHYAIQIAKAWGARVISTSSERNKDFILSLGADEHIDYTKQNFADILTDVDFVFDTLGGDTIGESIKVIRNGGMLVSIATMGDFPAEIQAEAEKKGISLFPFLVQSNGDDMSTLRDMLADGSVKSHVSRTFDFTDLGKAHAEVESGRTRGKVVVTIR